MIPVVTDMLLVENNQVLEFKYSCKTDQVSYCIADFAGNVIMRGQFDNLDKNKISISKLQRGMYTLCIVDGDTLVKNRFLKDQ
jgi:hypothetical protein